MYFLKLKKKKAETTTGQKELQHTQEPTNLLFEGGKTGVPEERESSGKEVKRYF